jgi:hypothetical protein
MNARHLTVLSLAAWLWLGSSLADTVRLKTGETYEGTILSETDTNVSIEVEYASGTILSTEIFSKKEIADIARSTPEQLAQRAMERAYANTQKYELHSTHNYPFNYYQQVIDRVLQRFLADYPNSPYTNAVQAKLQAWTAEQAKVASGLRNYKGVWMLAEEAARRNAEAQARLAAERAKPTDAVTTGDSSQKGIVDEVGGLLSRYWVVAIVVVVGALWLCVRIFTRD